MGPTASGVRSPTVRPTPPMVPTVHPSGHVGTTCGAVTGSPNGEPKPSKSRLKLGLASTSLAVGLFCGTPVLYSHRCNTTENLHQCRSSRNCLQATGHAVHWLSWSGNQGLGNRLRAFPNRPVWSGSAVQARSQTTVAGRACMHPATSLAGVCMPRACAANILQSPQFSPITT